MLEDYEGSRTEFMNMLAEQDHPPAYIMRAQRVEDAWQSLLRECRSHRDELLEMPKMRVGKLAQMIDSRWATLDAFVSASRASYLQQLYEQWQPQLRAPVTFTNSSWKIRSALNEVRTSFERFNRRWEAYVRTVNLTDANYARIEYNNYYVVEKSAALGSDRLAEMGFEPLSPLAHDDILVAIPLLNA